MDILKAFKLVDTEIIINIEGTYENPLFQANQIGKILEIKNIVENLRDFDENEKILSLTNTLGGIQNTVFLTEFGLYKLLGRSRKPIASVFQKWMINTIKEIRINGIYKLKEEIDIDKKLIKYKCDLERHKSLIKILDKENIVYICKLREENDKYLVKIGSSQNVKERMSHLANAYDNIEPILLDLIKINNYRKYETNLHNHHFIKKFYYPIPNKEGKISNETYLVNEEECKEFIKIFNCEKDKENCEEITLEKIEKIKEIEELKIKKEEIKLKKEENKLNQIIELKELKKNNFEKELLLLNNIDEDIDEDINDNQSEESNNSDADDIDLTTIYFSTKKMKHSIKIPFVHQYSPDNLITPIKIFESPSEVERCSELKHLEISPTPLRNAFRNNTIYKGYRWYFVKRDESPPEFLQETVLLNHKEPVIKFIAMIDITQTKILNVFVNQKEATKARLMKSNSFHRAIQNGSISSGHYWKYFDNCTKEMQDEYLKNNILPDKYVSGCSKKVQQICPKTKEILKTYDTNREVIKIFKMSVTSLKKYSDSGEIHNGYIWKIS